MPAAAGTQRPDQREQPVRLPERLTPKDTHAVALAYRVQQDLGEPVDRDEGAAIRSVEVRDPAASYPQCGAEVV